MDHVTVHLLRHLTKESDRKYNRAWQPFPDCLTTVLPGLCDSSSLTKSSLTKPLLQLEESITCTCFSSLGMIALCIIKFPRKYLKISIFLKVSHLLISLASTTSIPNGADHPWPGQSRVPQHGRTTGHREPIGVWACVWVGHWRDDCGLNHPLQILAGGNGINSGNKGTTGARHVDPVFLLKRKRKKERTLKNILLT